MVMDAFACPSFGRAVGRDSPVGCRGLVAFGANPHDFAAGARRVKLLLDHRNHQELQLRGSFHVRVPPVDLNPARARQPNWDTIPGMVSQFRRGGGAALIGGLARRDGAGTVPGRFCDGGATVGERFCDGAATARKGTTPHPFDGFAEP